MVAPALAVGGFLAKRLAARVALKGLPAFARALLIKRAAKKGIRLARTFAPPLALGIGLELVGRQIAPFISRPRREEPVAQAPMRRPSQAPVRRGTIVTPGPVPVTFVKSWRACEALFAIDDQGVRWVWRPKLGIWKRIRVTRNIVISGKDLRRAKRLVRISKRLNKMRTQLR